MIVNFFGNLLFKYKSLTKLLLSYNQDSLRIVYYHLITDHEKDYYFKNKSISSKIFKSHIKFFQKYFHIITFQEFIYLVENNKSLRGKLLITTDDGFVENYSLVAPILSDFKLKFTSFVITSCLNNKNLMWRNKLLFIQNTQKINVINKCIKRLSYKYNLILPNRSKSLLEWSWKNWDMKYKEKYTNEIWNYIFNDNIAEFLSENKPYLNNNQIKTLLNNGNYIGSHSHTHPDFSRSTLNNIYDELFKSEKYISENFNIKNIPFSYPFGMKAKYNFEYSNIYKFTNRNYLNNKNLIDEWGRDNLEFKMNKMILRLVCLPIVRSLIKH